MMYHPDRYAPHALSGPGGQPSKNFKILFLLTDQPVLEKPEAGAKVLASESPWHVASIATKDAVRKESWGSIVTAYEQITNFEYYGNPASIQEAQTLGFPLGDGPEPRIECACLPIPFEALGWIKGTSYFVFDDGLELFKSLFPAKDPKKFQNPSNLASIVVPYDWVATAAWEWTTTGSGASLGAGADKAEGSAPAKFSCPTWVQDDAQIGIVQSVQAERIGIIEAMIKAYADLGKPTSGAGQSELDSSKKASKSKSARRKTGAKAKSKPASKGEGGMGLLAVLGLAAVAYAASKK